MFAAAQQEPGLHLPPIVICTALPDRALAAVLKDCAVSLLTYDVRVVHKPFDIDTLTTQNLQCSEVASSGPCQHIYTWGESGRARYGYERRTVVCLTPSNRFPSRGVR